MPLFVIHAIDKHGALETRMANRPAHLEHVRANPGVKFAGPFLDEAGEPCGSMLVVEAEDLAALHEFCDADPYVKAGLFERVELRPWKVVVGEV